MIKPAALDSLLTPPQLPGPWNHACAALSRLLTGETRVSVQGPPGPAVYPPPFVAHRPAVWLRNRAWSSVAHLNQTAPGPEGPQPHSKELRALLPRLRDGNDEAEAAHAACAEGPAVSACQPGARPVLDAYLLSRCGVFSMPSPGPCSVVAGAAALSSLSVLNPPSVPGIVLTARPLAASASGVGDSGQAVTQRREGTHF